MSEKKLNVWERNTARTIKRVAKDLGFEVNGNHRCFNLDPNKHHANKFQVTLNAAGYFDVRQWESIWIDGEGFKEDWGRATLSIDDSVQASLFGTYLHIAMSMRAKRRRVSA